jgi:hypothetical protein
VHLSFCNDGQLLIPSASRRGKIETSAHTAIRGTIKCKKGKNVSTHNQGRDQLSLNASPRSPLPERIALHSILAAFLACALATFTARQHIPHWAMSLQLGGNRRLPHRHLDEALAVDGTLATRQNRHLPHQRRTASHLQVGGRSPVTSS